MLSLGHRYAHVPLAVLLLLLIVAAIAWLLERRVDGVWDSALRLAAPVPAAVAIVPGPAESGPAGPLPVKPPTALVTPAPPAPAPLASAPMPPAETPALPAVPGPPTAAPAPDERYALESGPFTSGEAADRLEDQLNRLGYATIRFRKQATTRLFVVTATGFASRDEARRAAAELGRGTVIETDEGPEVLLDRLPSLSEAIAAARPLRARDFDVRVEAETGPAVIYHIRYGQFGSQAAAQARSEELALLGVSPRVVKVR